MAESQESSSDTQAPPDTGNAAIRPGESKVDAVSRLLQNELLSDEQREQLHAGKPPPARDTAPLDDDPESEADPLGEIQTDDLGIAPAGGGDANIPSAALAELAEKAGTTIEEIYKLPVAMPDGRSSRTLGELKDSYQDVEAIEEQRGAFEAHRTAFENDMIRSRGELQEVLKMLPEIPEAVIAQARQKYAELIDNERAALLAVKPEWADPDKFMAAQDQMVEAIADYGFRKSDLSDVKDHRLTKLIYDFSVLKRRVSEAKASRKKLVRDHNTARTTSRTPPQTKQTRDAQVQGAATNGTLEDKVVAVHQLIHGTQ